MTAAEQEALKQRVLREVEDAVVFAKQSAFPAFADLPADADPDLYCREPLLLVVNRCFGPGGPVMRTLTYTQAISEAIREEIKRDETVFQIGEDIGPVRTPPALWKQFRKNRTGRRRSRSRPSWACRWARR